MQYSASIIIIYTKFECACSFLVLRPSHSILSFSSSRAAEFFFVISFTFSSFSSLLFLETNFIFSAFAQCLCICNLNGYEKTRGRNSGWWDKREFYTKVYSFVASRDFFSWFFSTRFFAILPALHYCYNDFILFFERCCVCAFRFCENCAPDT